MFIDARTVLANDVIDADLCIVGGGAAGITIAREFAGSDVRVALLESGSFEPEGETQLLYDGENVGMPYALTGARLRYFGGSTNHWGGWCRPLDPLDFEARPWVPHSGWPFGYDHLVPYYQRAQPTLELGPYLYETDQWAARWRPQLPLPSNLIRSVIYQYSPPTRFGQVYREEIRQAPNIQAFLHANLIDFERNDDDSAIQAVEVSTLEGKHFTVRARQFVLACGGIENARILLLANERANNRLGNQHDLVGRYYMEHPHVAANELVIFDSRTNLNLYAWENDYFSVIRKGWNRLRREVGDRPAIVRSGLAIPEEMQRQAEIMNFGLTFDPPDMSHLSVSAAEDGPAKDLRRLATDLADSPRGDRSPALGLRLYFRSEQQPNPDSRVSLSEQRDRFGLRKVKLDWRFNELDKRTILTSIRLIGRGLGVASFGRLRIDDWLRDEGWLQEGAPWDNLLGIGHPSGTTRMSEDPRRGVVDPDCRVHGVANLFVAGSSVFPTSGFANPTLTVVALAYRLADHLKRQLG